MTECKKKKIAFTSFQVYQNDKLFNFNNKFLSDLFKKAQEYNDELKYYLEYKSVKDEYIFLYFKMGKQSPYGEQVIKPDFSIDKNPKNPNDVELNEQLFVFYYKKEDILYLSNFKKIEFFKKILENQTESTIIIKPIYDNMNDFFEKLKILDKLKFTSIRRDLFSKQSDINNNLEDNYGIGEPIEFTVEAKYKETMTNKLRNMLQTQLNKPNNKNVLKKIIIQGKDENNFPIIFNEDNFTKKMTFPLQIDENGMCNCIEVFNKIKEILKVEEWANINLLYLFWL